MKIKRCRPLVIRSMSTKFGSPSSNGSICIMLQALCFQNLKCLVCDLDILPLTLKINRCRPLVIRSMHTKFDGPNLNDSVFIVFTKFTVLAVMVQSVSCLQALQTDRQTPVPYQNTTNLSGLYAQTDTCTIP